MSYLILLNNLLNKFSISLTELDNILNLYMSNDVELSENQLIIITEYYKIENLFKRQLLNEKDVKKLDWIDEWYNLFPAGVKTGGKHYIKSSKNSCETKLLKFIREYKFNKDTILKATQNYINDCKNNNYEYMSTAPYFIYKDNNSILSGYCEQLLENNKNISKIHIDDEINIEEI